MTLRTRIIAHELRLLRRDGVLVVALGVFAAAAAAAGVNGRVWADRQSAVVAEVAREESTRFAHVTTRLQDIEQRRYVPTDPYEDPSRPSIAGGWMAYRFATMPPAPLTALAVGQTDLRPAYAGATLWSTSWSSWLNRRVLVGESEIGNPINLVIGRFDLTFTIVYLLPLLIIVLTYGVIDDEREGGTLALVASQPLRLETLIAAKMSARALVAGGALMWIGLVAIAVLTSYDADAVLRLAAWLGGAIAYGELWLAIAAAAATRRGGAAANAMRLAAIWVALVVVLPALVNGISAWRHPLPDRADTVQQARAAQLAAEAENSGLTEGFYDQHPELAPERAAPDVRRYAATTVYAQHQEIDRRIAPFAAAFDAQLASHTRAIDRLAVLSPASGAAALLVDAAGTGSERYRHFQAQVEQFRAAWRAYFVPRLFRLERITSADVDDFPRFQFTDERAAAVAARVFHRSLWLLAPTLLLAWWSRRRLRRTPVLE